MERQLLLPSILHLTGITLRDYVPIEDVADEKVREAAGLGDGGEPGAAPASGRRGDTRAPAREAESPLPYDKIPKTFSTLEEWPLHTNLRCHECDFTFDDRPKFIATYIRVNDDGTYEIGVRGNFCTFNDAALHINRTYHNFEERWRALDMLKFVYNLFTGKTTAHIEPAPEKYKLALYGGAWSEETFWRKMRDLDPEHGLNNHTPGSVVSERARIGLTAKKLLAPLPASDSVFDICRRVAGLPPAGSLESQSVAVDCGAAGSPRPDNVDEKTAIPAENDLDSLISEIIHEA